MNRCLTREDNVLPIMADASVAQFDGIGGRLTAVLHVVQRFGTWNVLRNKYILHHAAQKRAAQNLMSGKKASQSFCSEEEARSLTLLQLIKSVRCTKGFYVSIRRGEYLVHGVFPLSAGRHSWPGIGQETRLGRLRGPEPQEHQCCLTCVPRISMNQSASLQNLVQSVLNLMTYVLAQGLDELDCR